MSERDRQQPDRLRLDKWLWHARVVRTRTLAQQLAADGYVRVNGTRAEQSSRPVRIGDVLTIALERNVRVLEIKALGDRRRSAAEARALFEELGAGQKLMEPALGQPLQDRCAARPSPLGRHRTPPLED